MKVQASVKKRCPKCKIVKRKGPIGIGEAIATVDGKIVAKGELTFAVVDNK